MIIFIEFKVFLTFHSKLSLVPKTQIVAGLALLYTLTFEKTGLLENSTFQPPVNVKEFGLCFYVEYSILKLNKQST